MKPAPDESGTSARIGNDLRKKRSDELPFPQLGRLGRTSWQRHLAAVATISFFWIVVGLAVTFGAIWLIGDSDLPLPAGYLVVNAGFVPLLAGVAVAVRLIHKRPIRTLVTPRRRIDLRRIAVSFAVYFTLASGASLVAALLHPERFSLTWDPVPWLTLLPVVVVVTSIQTSAEELLFRGYALQSLGLLIRRTWLLVVISALLFAAPHLANPEAAASLPLALAYYLAFGAFTALITLRDDRLELALGAHAANNLFVLVVNHKVTSLPIRPVWEVSVIDPMFNLISFLIGAAVFYWLLVARVVASVTTAPPDVSRGRTPGSTRSSPTTTTRPNVSER